MLWANFLQAQSYNNWITGDANDVTPSNYKSGIVLAGGGGDNDDAMQWMLERADGGDIVVIRASNSDGYNNYFYSELGVNVNSVETIRFNDISAASDDYVIQQIRNAEVLFIAGGDQYDYYEFWKDNAIEEAINYLINEKGITVGGTSAGMAILGNAYYTPSAGSLTTGQALANPYHPNVEILGQDDFIEVPILSNLVTDTHYDDRNRSGRHMVFLARLAATYEEQVFGIACNEWTAVCIDENNIATVYGEYPDYEEYAYFLKSNCFNDIQAEILETSTRLTWNKNGRAVKVYQAPGKVDGSTRFNLNDWTSGNGGNWQNWYVDEGTLIQEATTETGCGDGPLSPIKASKEKDISIKVMPNPTTACWTVSDLPQDTKRISLFSSNGVKIETWEAARFTREICLPHSEASLYFLKVESTRKVWTIKLVNH